MLRTGAISDELWAVIEPVMPMRGGRRGRPWNDHRLTLEGIVWRFRTGTPWRDVPDHFGSWQSLWERHNRWSVDGTYVRMFTTVQAGTPDGGAELMRLLSVDSTNVRVHQHAAGAPKPDTGGSLE
ncbi:IS5 family transposase [Fodinicola feengrottensis]|uniref:IS5 family transposase n=1 Tax=Fodinicola feengrottensis TaxID=435914 RepID=A0ABN2GLC2_9ACTN